MAHNEMYLMIPNIFMKIYLNILFKDTISYTSHKFFALYPTSHKFFVMYQSRSLALFEL